MKTLFKKLAKRFDERANPILVKEIYQGLRGRALTGTGAVVLVGPLFFYVAMMVMGKSDDAAEAYFGIVVSAMAFASIFVVPLAANRVLVGEMQSRTLELIALTRLTPWEIVSGRFQAALVKSGLIIALLAPFAVSAVLMGATGADSVGFMLLTVTSLGMVGTSFCLMLGSLSSISIKLANAGNIVYLGFCFMVSVILTAVIFRPFGGSSGMGSSATAIWLWLFALSMGVVAFFLRLGADLLTMITPRTYAASKLAFFILGAIYCVPIAGDDFFFSGSIGNDADEAVGSGMFIAGCFCALWGAAKEEPQAFDGKWFFPFRNRHEDHLFYCTLVTSLLALAGTQDGIGDLVLYWGGAFLLLLSLVFFAHQLLPRHRRTAPFYFLIFFLLVFINIVLTISWFGAESNAMGEYNPGPLASVLPIVITDEWRGGPPLDGLEFFLPPIFALILTLMGRRIGNRDRRPAPGA